MHLLYERYKDYVARLSLKFSRDRDTARDLTQDAFLKAFKSLKQFRGDAAFKTWLTRIVVNTATDYLRKVKADKAALGPSLDDPDNAASREIPETHADLDPHHHAWRKQLSGAVWSALQTLSEEHRTAILLWQEGLSYAEIAMATNVPSETVGSRIYYAKMQLKKLLKDYEPDK
jgi:RNA polymerase sigma-70 factor (ECF subfamily)